MINITIFNCRITNGHTLHGIVKLFLKYLSFINFFFQEGEQLTIRI
jgi:hypothetical protein